MERQVMSHLAKVDQIAPASASDLSALANKAVKTKKAKFAPAVTEFYLTNPIARSSAVMGECAALASGLKQAAE